MEITFDPHKRATNLDKHGFDFADLDMAFFTRATVVPAKGDRLMAGLPTRSSPSCSVRCERFLGDFDADRIALRKDPHRPLSCAPSGPTPMKTGSAPSAPSQPTPMRLRSRRAGRRGDDCRSDAAARGRPKSPNPAAGNGAARRRRPRQDARWSGCGAHERDPAQGSGRNCQPGPSAPAARSPASPNRPTGYRVGSLRQSGWPTPCTGKLTAPKREEFGHSAT